MRRHNTTRGILVLIWFCFCWSNAWAKTARKLPVLIMPVKAKGLDLDTAKKVGSQAGVTLVHQLKTLRLFQVKAGKAISNILKRMKKKNLYGSECLDQKKCIRRLGKRFRVRVIYVMRLSDDPKGVELMLTTIDVRSAKILRTVSEVVPRDNSATTQRATWLTRKASSPMISTLLTGKGRLKVNCEHNDAELEINSKSFGKRTNKGFRVSAGVFEVSVKLEGYRPFYDVVVVQPNKNLEIKAQLEPIRRSQEMIADKSKKTKPAFAESSTSETKKAEPPPPLEAAPNEQKQNKADTNKAQAAQASTSTAAQPDVKKAEKPKEDLPAWAIFDKRKEQSKTAQTDKTKSEPYLPQQVPTRSSKKYKHELAWYKTWWFWSLVLVGTGGAGLGGLYAAGVFDSSGGSETGSAIVRWQ